MATFFNYDELTWDEVANKQTLKVSFANYKTSKHSQLANKINFKQSRPLGSNNGISKMLHWLNQLSQ
jgi:hypothetical protein